jgi:hypothetical protein
MPEPVRSKFPVAQVVALVAALGLAAAALTTLLGGEPEQPEVEVDEKGQPLSEGEIAERDHDRFVAAARGQSPPGYGELLRVFSEAGPGFYGNGQLEIDDTRRVFDAVMDEVERMAERPRPLRQRQWQEVYRGANDSFTALSMHLDARDREQAKELEEAHRRLRQGLANLRVRGKKFRIEH